MIAAYNISDRVSEQLMQICSRNSARASIPLLLSVLLTYLLLVNKVDTLLLQVWSLASCTIVLVRVILLKAVNRKNSISQSQRRNIAVTLTFILGCTEASVLYFFPHVGSFERAMLTAIMLGLCTGSPSTNIGYRPLLLSYISPMLGVLAVLWILNLDQSIHPAMAWAVGISILIVGFTMLMNGKSMFETFALSIESSTKLEEQSERLSEALREAEHARVAAETSSQSKTRFIAAASHDLRQPVHVLNLFGAALKRGNLDEKSIDIVDNMNIAVTSLSSQLNALLDISELDSGSVKPNLTSVDLSMLAETLMRELEKLAEDKQIRILNEVPQGLFVQTDPAMLSQIIRNLCGNAIKYTHAGQVVLRAGKSDMDVVLSIIDTGIGIEDAETVRVFEEFYQVCNPSRNKNRGMGLGLSIVERLSRSLGHKLELQSKVGVGTSVFISMKHCTLAQISITRTPLVVEPNIVNLPKDFWVHLVDDDEAVQQSVEAFLHAAKCKITITQTSAETINFLKHVRPSVMLIDLRLENSDSGLNVVDYMTKAHPDLPIALITGESLTDGKVAKQYPGLLMLQKPVSEDALLELLDYMILNAMESTIPVTNEKQPEH